MSITYRSVKGSELEHAEVDENFRYLDEKSIQYIVGHKYRGPVVRIYDNKLYRLVDSVDFPYTATNFLDELANGDWILITGFSDEILSNFVKKSFSAHFAFNGSGVDTSIPLNPNGYSEIRITNPALESISGIDLSLISGNPSAEVPYTGKMYLLKNITGNTITIKHNSEIADIPFYTNDEQNLEVPNKGSVIFTYDNAVCEILLTNFSVGTASIPSLDEVLEVSGYSERSATVGDLKVKSFQIGDNFIPNSSGAIFRIERNSDDTINVILESVSHTDSDNFGRVTATLSNEDGVIFRHLANDNNEGVIAKIRKDGILFSLINSFLKVDKDGVARDVLLSGLAQITDIINLESTLNNKADLFNGIVPQEQSQGSSLIMESSNYKIIYTDPRGEVYEIDLPIESLFRDANYDSETKTLILTLDSGDTIKVSLEDLVDLPEIQIENINPSVSPSDGKKVYFNISNGKIYLNYQNEWAFLGNAISDTEKSNINTAYIHLQATGNPHNTTKADIGLGNVDNTSDLNKPISNATQNALNSKENSSNKVTDFTSPNNTTFPTTQAVINENKKATITVELINLLTTSFYAPNALRINSTALINGSGTITLKVNDVAYTLGNLIAQGAKITVETTTASVYNLIVIYE